MSSEMISKRHASPTNCRRVDTYALAPTL